MGILAGLRVVEVSAFVAAPSAGLALCLLYTSPSPRD